MVTKYPASIDTTTTLPRVVDKVTPISADIVNRLRDAIIAVEMELGLKPSGTYTTVRARLDAMETALNGGILLGDVTGSIVNTTVAKIQHRAISTTAPTDGYALVWSAGTSQWTPQQVNGSGGTLGGDVTGLAISNTVTKLQNRNVASTAPSDGYTLTWDAGLSQWMPKLVSGSGGTLAGDVTGLASSNTVTKLQNRTVDSTAPTDGYVLTWVAGSSFWSPRINTGSLLTITSTTISYTVLSSDQFIAVGTTASGITITLPALPQQGKPIFIKDTVGLASTNNITISGNGHNIDNASSTIIINDYGSLQLVYSGTKWMIV